MFVIYEGGTRIRRGAEKDLEVRSGVCHVCESLTLAYEEWTRLR